MGGYELMISADILRGRYRDAFDAPQPVSAGKKQLYRFGLPTANHVFQPGHRIMVQIPSSRFPLYDRNPQKYVKNMFFATGSDYQKATIQVFEGPQASFIDLPVVKPGLNEPSSADRRRASRISHLSGASRSVA